MESDTTPQVRPIPIPTSRRPQVLATDLPIMPAPINTDLLRLSRERHFNIDDFNQVFAATTTSVSAVMIPAYQIRLLPLKTSISLRFDPITRVCREGAPAIKICRFIDPTGIGLASSNDSLTGKISFNSKVISRQHAELWCEANGTVSLFIIWAEYFMVADYLLVLYKGHILVFRHIPKPDTTLQCRCRISPLFAQGGRYPPAWRSLSGWHRGDVSLCTDPRGN